MYVHACAWVCVSSCVNSHKKHFQCGFKGILLTLPARWKSYKNLCAAYNVLSHNIRPGLITFSGSGNFNNKIKSTHSHSWKPCLSVSLSLSLSHFPNCAGIIKFIGMKNVWRCRNFPPVNILMLAIFQAVDCIAFYRILNYARAYTHRDIHTW